MSSKNSWNRIRIKIIYLLYPLIFCIKRKRYDKILAWQQFLGLNLAFWCRLFHLKKHNRLYVMTFIYKTKPGLIGKIYDKYMRFIVSSKYIDGFICFSSLERDYYSSYFNMPNKFIFLPLGIDKIELKKENVFESVRNRIFSTGFSNRNYPFLIESLADTDYNVVIACGDWKYNGKLPNNVKLLRNCYGSDMLEEMQKSFAVVIPLNDLKVSSGQLVMLQAMQLKRPIIITRSNGSLDYINDGINGLLMDNNNKSLLSCLKRLEIPDEYRKITNNAFKSFIEKHTVEAMAKNILAVMNNV